MPSTFRTHIKKEFLFIGTVFFLAYFTAAIFNLSENFFYFLSKFEKYNIDEIFIAINITGITVFIYSLMRINFMSKEIKRRIEAEKTVDWISSHDIITSLPNQKFLDSFLSLLKRLPVGKFHPVNLRHPAFSFLCQRIWG